MSWDINRVILIGRLANDPELKYTPSGTAVMSVSIAVGEKPKQGEDSGVSFFNLKLWGKTAENVSAYMSKGKQLAIDGRLQQRRWQTDEGKSRSVVEIVCDRVEFLGGNPNGNNQNKNNQNAKSQQQNKKSGDTFNDNDFDNGDFYNSGDFTPNPEDAGHGDPEF